MINFNSIRARVEVVKTDCEKTLRNCKKMKDILFSQENDWSTESIEGATRDVLVLTSDIRALLKIAEAAKAYIKAKDGAVAAEVNWRLAVTSSSSSSGDVLGLKTKLVKTNVIASKKFDALRKALEDPAAKKPTTR